MKKEKQQKQQKQKQKTHEQYGCKMFDMTSPF